ncbi:hypothetical protein ACOSQ2_021741 [Xanthoceras sorbifolium]
MKEFGEERLVRSNAGKDKDPAFKKHGVPLDSGNTLGTNLLVPLTDIVKSSRVSEASPLLSVSLEEVLGKVLKGDIRSAEQKNAYGFQGDTVERQL